MKDILSIRVSKETRARLDREAKRLGITTSELVRRGVERLLLDVRLRTGSMYDRVAESIGVWSSGIGDLAAEHSRYVREKLVKKRKRR